VRGPELLRLLVEHHAHAACCMGHSLSIGIGRDAGQVHAAAVKMPVSRLEAENQPENRRSCDRIFRWPPPDGIVAEDRLFKLCARR
jgi:hypothetical protein